MIADDELRPSRPIPGLIGRSFIIALLSIMTGSVMIGVFMFGDYLSGGSVMRVMASKQIAFDSQTLAFIDTYLTAIHLAFMVALAVERFLRIDWLLRGTM